MFLNVLSNAIKYHRAAGRVTHSCEELPGGERLWTEVADTGRGLRAEDP